MKFGRVVAASTSTTIYMKRGNERVLHVSLLRNTHYFVYGHCFAILNFQFMMITSNLLQYFSFYIHCDGDFGGDWMMMMKQYYVGGSIGRGSSFVNMKGAIRVNRNHTARRESGLEFVKTTNLSKFTTGFYPE